MSAFGHGQARRQKMSIQYNRPGNPCPAPSFIAAQNGDIPGRLHEDRSHRAKGKLRRLGIRPATSVSDRAAPTQAVPRWGQKPTCFGVVGAGVVVGFAVGELAGWPFVDGVTDAVVAPEGLS